MCGFISWVEKDGKIFFLTDEEVFSPHGRVVFSDCKNNDVLGHGAIRKYFGKDGAPMQGGVNKEVEDFWNTNKLPLEIAKLISEFDKHWYRIFTSGVFQNSDLLYIIIHAPPKWKEKALEQLLEQNPGNYVLRYIDDYASPKLRYRALERFLKQNPNPSNDTLRYIHEYASPKLRDKFIDLLNSNSNS